MGHWLDIDLCWNLELGLSSVDGNSFPVESPWKEKSSRDHFCRPSRGAVLDTKIVTWRFSHCSREQTPERFIAVFIELRRLWNWVKLEFHCSRNDRRPSDGGGRIDRPSPKMATNERTGRIFYISCTGTKNISTFTRYHIIKKIKSSEIHKSDVILFPPLITSIFSAAWNRI